ncbi:ABC transporter permease subunit [Geoalkalibacter halelectricus]|uniref:ABC transporter permease subunit n=1 Tax=Geoalkalibacter halelectricus TaxID=2847045 RepID=A0ABY5ZJ81_9BACT|nr:ABC transporter permease subunit [Geoalkalibacter halelectricus]MDO3377736.1 ABC transporter permease subunit [Geoalkalibacter halelectricus]UWZ78668.1 ABC transporter permease subunit [Geoalkalibacter halelectricus]
MREDNARTSGTNNGTASGLPDQARRDRLKKWRRAKDHFSTYGVSAGGLGVVFALALIFIYLFYEVFPLLRSADITPVSSYALHEGGIEHFSLERYNELAAIHTSDGRVRFLEAGDGQLRREVVLPLPEDASISAFAAGDPSEGLFIYGLDDGRALVARTEYRLSYPQDRRHIEPQIAYPLGAEAVSVDAAGAALRRVAVQETGRGFTVAAATDDGRLLLAVYTATVSLFTGEVSLRRQEYILPSPAQPAEKLLIDGAGRNLFVTDALGAIHYYDISNPAAAILVHSVAAVAPGATISAVEFLKGSVSLIVGGTDGTLSQWFLVRDADNVQKLTRIRDFLPHAAAITTLAPEYNRKGFVAADASGSIGIHYATSQRTLLMEPISDKPLVHLGLSPVNIALLAVDEAGRVHYFDLDNPHPQVSMSALWSKVWYEGREGPAYVWQSSSASDDFESKFSLVPLTLGTLKAAFFAMLFAIPLAIMAAVYSAYFMTRALRGFVKPTIEVMEALPTVILGFLAGLWLAPFIERNLPAVFAIFLFIPLAMLLASFLWSCLPADFRARISPGWEGALLVPVVLVVGWLCVAMSPQVEVWFFDGSMRQWLTEVGITYDQRNALVVGIAMGFAVIPTIFSITEDAVFNVPKHLTQGSMALGATPWQTVVGVVIPTASPGIFSAVMIGFGRAVGETMIVLMATGNSPITNFNIFEGMRTLSANIAVELPETAVASTHFRILFLSALVLFVITFIVNTVAEVVRQRLRKRYSSL